MCLLNGNSYRKVKKDENGCYGEVQLGLGGLTLMLRNTLKVI
jgi:hypothetical protein